MYLKYNKLIFQVVTKYLKMINDCISFPFWWTIIPPPIFYDWTYDSVEDDMQIFLKPQTLTKTKYFNVERMTQILKKYFWAFVHSLLITDACVRKVIMVECSFCLRSFNRSNILSDTQRQDKIRFSCTQLRQDCVVNYCFSQRLN